ncbi:MAG: DUF6364 family protein [Candidatus Thiosymbion ectosymbiont of Robbea hypermnestra]|nr:DUF6364 family protein [Candidatus Thiosymbion ectosymbiont of Robbea hypermnestra]
MTTQKLTVRLPVDEIAYLKTYAQAHRITVTEMLHRYLERLRGAGSGAIHPEVSRISGLIPSAMDAEADIAKHLEDKHQ